MSGHPHQPYLQPQLAPPPGADPQLWQWFTSVDEDHSGSITVTELQSALVNGALRPVFFTNATRALITFIPQEIGQVGIVIALKAFLILMYRRRI
jgi:hypothetical protein